nr:perakine reductase-like isoform X2 [Ipomoea trifida]
MSSSLSSQTAMAPVDVKYIYPWRNPIQRRDWNTKMAAAFMPRVKLGSQGLQVSKLGYGCMGLTGVYNNPVSEEEGIALIKEAFSKGVTFFDTSDFYGADHANEYLVGKKVINSDKVTSLERSNQQSWSDCGVSIETFAQRKIELATKFGICRIESTEVIVKGTPEYVRSCCEASLKRLQVDYIDLYYVHRIDTTVPIEETLTQTQRRAHAVHPITALQQEYSLWTRDIEEDIIPLCRELGIGVVSYSPVGRGLFGGKAVVESLPASSFLGSQPRYSGENIEKNKGIYYRVEELAKKHGCTPAQLAIAWVLNQGDDFVPIPGTTKMKNLQDNIDSVKVKVKLTKEELKEISNAVPISEVAGQRMGGVFDKTLYKYAITPPLKQ